MRISVGSDSDASLVGPLMAPFRPSKPVWCWLALLSGVYLWPDPTAWVLIGLSTVGIVMAFANDLAARQRAMKITETISTIDPPEPPAARPN